jgi:hypothetical protein
MAAFGGAIEHDTEDGRFSTQHRMCGRSVAALDEISRRPPGTARYM